MVVEGTPQTAAEVYDVEVEILDKIWEVFCEPTSPYRNPNVIIPPIDAPRSLITFRGMDMAAAANLCAHTWQSILASDGDYNRVDYHHALTQLVVILSHS